MNYESEINEKLLHSLQKTFSISNNELLHEYLMSRFLIHFDFKIWSKDLEADYMTYLLHILGIREFRYKEELLSMNPYKDNSLTAILNDWFFRIDIEYGKTPDAILVCAKENVKGCLAVARKQMKKYRNHSEYPLILKESHLNELNKMFKIRQYMPEQIDGFNFMTGYLPEELMLAYRNGLVLNEPTENVEISEKELEDYLYRRLHEVEEGLKPISRQVGLKAGVVDILAKDKNENLVIIELKVEDDKDLVWQQKYYTDEIRKQYPNDNIRFLVIAPVFHEPTIRYLKNAEFYIYSAITQSSKLKFLRISKFNLDKEVFN